jgi:hypothetical protein
MPRAPLAGAETLFSLREVSREREVPWEIDQALRQGAPQAILRDLHRPVPSFEINPYEFEEVPMIRNLAGSAETSELKKAFLASYRVPIVDLVHTTKDMLGEFRALKATLARPWTDAPKLADARARAEARKFFK